MRVTNIMKYFHNHRTGKAFILLLMLVVLTSFLAFPVFSSLSDNDYRQGYKLDDVTDETTNFNLTNEGTVIFTPGMVGDSANFSGSNALWYEGEPMSLAEYDNDWTWSVWFKPDSITGTQVIMFNYINTPGRNQYILLIGNDLDFFNYNGAVHTFEFDGDIVTDQWYHAVVTHYANNDLVGYLDGVMIANISADFGSTTRNAISHFGLGANPREAGSLSTQFDGVIDSAYVWNYQINGSDVATLYNSGDGKENSFAPITVDTGSVELWTTNESYQVQDTFLAGTEFLTLANWTNSTDSPITNDTGYCNVTFSESVEEVKSLFNETICKDNFCDYHTTYSEDFDNNTIDGLSHYDLRFNVCFEDEQGDKNVFAHLTSDGGDTDLTISPAQIPKCVDGFLTVSLPNYDANLSENVSIELVTENKKYKRIRVDNLEVDLNFGMHSHLMDYNVSLELWTTDEHENYDTGVYNISVECIDTDTGDLNATDSHEYSVGGFPPQINFNYVSTLCGDTNLTDNMQLEYCDSVWTWFGSINSQTINFLNVSWYDSLGTILHSHQETNFTQMLDTPDELFLDFDNNPFNITVIFNNTEFEVTESLLFYVNDTVVPTATATPTNMSNLFGLSDIIVTGLCTDDALYKFNHTISNIADSTVFYAYEKTAIEDTVWYHDGIFNISGATQSDNSSHATILSNLTCYDAHTNTELLKEWILDKPRLDTVEFFDGKVSIELLTDVKKFDVIKDFDRYVFDIEKVTPSDNMIYKLNGDWVEVKNSDYPCHAVNTKENLWFDAVDDGVTSCSFEKVAGSLIATAVYDVPKSIVLTKSIGELNVWSELTYYTNYDASIETVEIGGITCGENYPNNIHVLNLTGDTIFNCSIRVNNKLHYDDVGACGTYNLTTDLGRNLIKINAINALGDSIEQTCEINTDKYVKNVGDFALPFFLMFIWLGILALFLTLTGPHGDKIQILNMLQVLVGIVSGLAMIPFSIVITVGICATAGAIFILSNFNDESD